jgi:Sigma-70 region 2
MSLPCRIDAAGAVFGDSNEAAGAVAERSMSKLIDLEAAWPADGSRDVQGLSGFSEHVFNDIHLRPTCTNALSQGENAVTSPILYCLIEVHMNESTNFLASKSQFTRTNPFADTGPEDDGPSDEELSAAALAGNKDLLETLIRRHQPWVFNIAMRMIWGRDLAEDATQEILIKIVTKLSTFRGESKCVRHALTADQKKGELSSLKKITV